jgi:hypothetical protein
MLAEHDSSLRLDRGADGLCGSAERGARWEASEPKAFRDLQEACRHGDARDVYRAFSVWRWRTDRATAVVPFAEEIESVLFASAAWSPARSRAFAQGLEAVRRSDTERRRRPSCRRSIRRG